MKFFEGMIIGGMIALCATMVCTQNNLICKSDTKKLMKKGKQFARKMGLV